MEKLLLKKKFEEMLQLLIEHGGDIGGAYFSYPTGLEESVEEIKNELGLNDYIIQWQRTDEFGYTYNQSPKLIKKDMS